MRGWGVGPLLLSLLPASALAAEPAASIEELLARVKDRYASESKAIAAREAEFVANKNEQKKLLAAARKALADEEAKSVRLEKAFRNNEIRLTELEETLRVRLGTMGELFGVVRQVAGDTAEQVRTSLASVDRPGRVQRLRDLAEAQSLPRIAELEHIWHTLLEEMAESGKVVRVEAEVIDEKGATGRRRVVRVGNFNAVSEDGYLQFLPEVQKLAMLARQPPDVYVGSARRLAGATSGPVRFALDPSRGAILGLLVETPTLEERLQLGGTVGYIILGLGFFALLVGLAKFVSLLLADLKIRRQQRSRIARADNPLGRILGVYEQNRGIPPEDLERKLDEVIVRESSKVDRFIWIVKVVAVSAPLLGLLGTVTGMIRTFQAITLFGTGDPKLMAGGISEALVTTMLGLVVAVPLVLVHAVLSNTSRRIVDVLDEQAAGAVARQAEREAVVDG